MKRGKAWVSILLALLLTVGLLPCGVLAAGAVATDQIADFTAEDGGAAALQLLTGGDGSLASWDRNTKVLTLSGVDFTTTAPVGVMVPDGTTVVLTAGTTNRIVSSCAIQEGYSCGIACGELDLIWYEMTDQQGYEVSLLGDLTVRGQGTLYAEGGGINAANKGYYSIGIGAHRLTILEGTVTAVGGTVENGAYSVGIMTSYTKKDGVMENGDLTISGGNVTASSSNYGLRAYIGTVFVSGSAQVYVQGGVTAKVLDVSGGKLTAEGSFGVSANLNITGGTVSAKGTRVGISCSSGSNTINGGTVRVEGGALGACIFDYGSVSITGGELSCGGSFWCYNLSVTGG